ncbi:Uncharacterized protein TCM_013625 [Theobroma cacao]|uniref:Uncharacterized protein n=1 Tax=Theobroma cacao TaxID=3641 RepID=A0A061FWJ6_THECC|nr:Uncharacterized protein TCM_013625 [Theobroma cacao]
MFRGAPVAHSMSRSDGSPNTPHCTSEGSLDSTARSQCKESLDSSESLKSKDSSNIQEAIRNFLLQRSEERCKEKAKEAIAKGDIRPRKISVVRHFPPGCGIGTAPVSKEEYIRIQQA